MRASDANVPDLEEEAEVAGPLARMPAILACLEAVAVAASVLDPDRSRSEVWDHPECHAPPDCS